MAPRSGREATGRCLVTRPALPVPPLRLVGRRRGTGVLPRRFGLAGPIRNPLSRRSTPRRPSLSSTARWSVDSRVQPPDIMPVPGMGAEAGAELESVRKWWLDKMASDLRSPTRRSRGGARAGRAGRRPLPGAPGRRVRRRRAQDAGSGMACPSPRLISARSFRRSGYVLCRRKPTTAAERGRGRRPSEHPLTLRHPRGRLCVGSRGPGIAVADRGRRR